MNFHRFVFHMLGRDISKSFVVGGAGVGRAIVLRGATDHYQKDYGERQACESGNSGAEVGFNSIHGMQNYKTKASRLISIF
jgi:hypothetical protein